MSLAFLIFNWSIFNKYNLGKGMGLWRLEHQDGSGGMAAWGGWGLEDADWSMGGIMLLFILCQTNSGLYECHCLFLNECIYHFTFMFDWFLGEPLFFWWSMFRQSSLFVELHDPHSVDFLIHRKHFWLIPARTGFERNSCKHLDLLVSENYDSKASHLLYLVVVHQRK